jgi:hypothetical protein
MTGNRNPRGTSVTAAHGCNECTAGCDAQPSPTKNSPIIGD